MINLKAVDWYLVSEDTGEIYIEEGDLIRPAMLSDFLGGFNDQVYQVES